MVSIYFILLFYNQYLAYFIPDNINIQWKFLGRKIEAAPATRFTALKRINEKIADLDFFSWFEEHLPLLKKYHKQALEDPHVNIRITDHTYEQYAIYKQLEKKKFSKVI